LENDQDTTIFDDDSIFDFFPQLPEILVVGGKTAGEIVLQGAFVVNENVTLVKQNFPSAIFGATGTLTSQNVPTVCGGKNGLGQITNLCYQLINETWFQSTVMVKKRFQSQSAQFQGQTWVLGGDVEKSTEFWENDQWKLGPNMPLTLSKHCAVPLEDDKGSILVIGGIYIK